MATMLSMIDSLVSEFGATHEQAVAWVRKYVGDNAHGRRKAPDPMLPLLSVVRESDQNLLDRITDIWNTWAAARGCSQVVMLTGQRAIHCRQRINELLKLEQVSDPAEAFTKLLSRCDASFFVKGQPRKPLCFDQLMREGFMAKMVEGEYAYRKANGGTTWAR